MADHLIGMMGDWDGKIRRGIVVTLMLVSAIKPVLLLLHGISQPVEIPSGYSIKSSSSKHGARSHKLTVYSENSQSFKDGEGDKTDLDEEHKYKLVKACVKRWITILTLRGMTEKKEMQCLIQLIAHLCFMEMMLLFRRRKQSWQKDCFEEMALS
ncbi:hypothetical protein Pyn_01891 [Prunus yedoensis var. nudiflora]|uniref:Uncharacterized protein n=1 Tax=Prunus yedoensis var. nudiflora TaxID=2094558 RepID=A0A314Z702_PRUYE|nr:hypothetical protein Pyn_01891 [Prunus yedoensis var. nudiflora]